jgi:Na+/proline symporter
MTLLGTLVGGFMFFGLSAMGYEAGLAGMGVGVGYFIGLILLAVFAERIKKVCDNSNCDTIDDVILVNYGPTAQLLSVGINFVVFIGILGAQFIAVKSFFSVFSGLNSSIMLYLAVGIVIIYTAMSGFRGVLLTDFWQVSILSVSIVVIFLVAFSSSTSAELATLPTSHFTGTGYGVGFLVGAIILFPFSLFCRSDLWQRIACAKDVKVVRKAFLICAPILLTFYGLLTMLGVYAAAHLGSGRVKETAGIENFILIVRSNWGETFASELFLAVLALGVFAALLSTADSYLNIVAVSISKVVRPKAWSSFNKEQQTSQRSDLESSLLRSTRMICFVLGLVAFAVALMVPDIVTLIVGASSAIFVLLPSVISVLRGKKETSYIASITSICIGSIVYVISFLSLANPKIAFIPATFASATVFLLIPLILSRQGKALAIETDVE